MRTRSNLFFGWRVVGAVFVLAMFRWGVGFYGPPVYLHSVREARGWPLTLVSTAVTVHFLIGVPVIASLPSLYRRFGVPAVTKSGCIALATGIIGWALAREPWQLFLATLLSGGGWVTMGAAAVNAIVSPWFVRERPAALASAYNGASIGGMVFSPLWAAAIGLLGFPAAAFVIGLVMVATIWVLADRFYSRTPEQMGLVADGDATSVPSVSVTSPLARSLPGNELWWDWRFITLAIGMAFGLFAQIGLLAHLFSLLVPALGAQLAGVAAGAARVADLRRTSLRSRLPPGQDWQQPAALLMCDDVQAEIARLAKKGIPCGAVSDEGWGLLTAIRLPGGGDLGLYEPRHAIPRRLTRRLQSKQAKGRSA